MASSSSEAARQNLSSNVVKQVAIVGGTHGNETNGVYLAKHFAENAALLKRETFATEVVLANVAAISTTPTQARRYVETDLNRCFFLKELADETMTSLEHQRARVLDAQLGPKSSASPRTDYIFDLHNTTANTGISLMMSPRDVFSHELGAYLMTLDADVRIVNWADMDEWGMLPTVARSGMTFEVGACPWSCIVGKWYEKSRRLLLAALDYIDQHNKIVAGGAATFELMTRTTPVFQRAYTLDYPQTTRDGRNDVDAMIHPSLDGRDFQEIKEGDDLFMKLDSTSVKFSRTTLKDADKEGPLYPFFLNEAAYYEKGIAMMLARVVQREYPVAVPKA